MFEKVLHVLKKFEHVETLTVSYKSGFPLVILLQFEYEPATRISLSQHIHQTADKVMTSWSLQVH